MPKTVRYMLKAAKELDRLRSLPAPTPGDARKLCSLIADATAASYFFRDEYGRPTWVQRLDELDFFRKCSRLSPDKGRRWVIFRELSAYLNRVAEQEPKQVADILASLSTADQWATGQLMKATLALPDDHAARVVPQFAKWCRPDNPFGREEEVVELAGRMLDSGHSEEFCRLLKLLLRPVVKTRGYDIAGTFFDENLMEFVQDGDRYGRFCQLAPAECLAVAEQSLRRAIRLRAKAPDPFEGLRGGRKEDPSSGMRSAIEDHEQNRYPDFEDGLAVAVRDALAECVRQSPSKAEATIRRYLRREWSIFRRLALHALTENRKRYARLAISAVFRRLSGLKFFEDANLHHEYWRLVPAVFDELPARSQTRLLRWIDAAYPGADERAKKWFTYRRLMMLADCDLPPHGRRRLEELRGELPEPEHPEFLVYGGPARWGPPEPAVNLEGKSTDEIWNFIHTWKPDPAKPYPFGPSYSGVGQELRRVVKADLAKYRDLVERMASDVATWMADDPKRKWATYVGYALDAYEQTCREGQEFDWAVVLDLADAGVPTGVPPDQWPDPTPRETDVPELGYDWAGVRHAVSHLIEVGISASGAGMIPEVQVGRARDILVRLARDPFPTLEYEGKREREHQEEQRSDETRRAAPVDWHQVAINSNRPEAAGALLRYAVRHANPIVKELRDEPRVELAIRDALSALADDPCRSVHAMLGSWLGVLWWLDGDWLEGVLGRILPLSADRSDIWEAAWVAFVRYGVLYPKLHQHLVPHYRRSIEQCARRSEEDPHLKGLCKHLAAIHAWGWDEVPGAERLICRFYEAAEDDAASELAEAFGGFARSLDKAGDEAPQYWQRIESLVRQRLEQTRPQAGAHVKELRTLGTWLDAFIERSRGDLGDMADVLGVIASVPLGHWQFERVVEFLDASQAEAHPLIAARLLRQMLSTCDRDAWYWERDKINSILDTVLASDDPGAHRDALKAIELLWEQGEWEPFERHKEQIVPVTRR